MESSKLQKDIRLLNYVIENIRLKLKKQLTCSVVGCMKERVTGNITYCNMHYHRLLKHGTVGPSKPKYLSSTYVTEQLHQGLKTCKICSKIKPLSDFAATKAHRTGRQSYCRVCQRHENFQRRYGITAQRYQDMLEAQNYQCYLCNTKIEELKNEYRKTLVVDHCHLTGKVRKLLCDKCNKSISIFENNRALLLKTLDYLF